MNTSALLPTISYAGKQITHKFYPFAQTTESKKKNSKCKNVLDYEVENIVNHSTWSKEQLYKVRTYGHVPDESLLEPPSRTPRQFINQ